MQVAAVEYPDCLSMRSDRAFQSLRVARLDVSDQLRNGHQPKPGARHSEIHDAEWGFRVVIGGIVGTHDADERA